MIKAALFDLDGTLLDSLWVWKRVDENFFLRRGMEVPADYERAITGMGFMATAVYTKERFGLAGSADEIAAEWTRSACDEYAKNVPLKKGSREFIRALKAKGVRCCVVTASRRELYEPCLIHNGILDEFEFVLTADEAGGGTKRTGEIYRIAAERLGAAPEECVVFEDVLEGVVGAKKQGMKVYCIKDRLTYPHLEEITALADGVAEEIMETAGQLL